MPRWTTTSMPVRQGSPSVELGLVTGGQARGIGFTRHQIDRRIVTDRWTRVTRDVFAVRGSPPSWRRTALGGLSGWSARHRGVVRADRPGRDARRPASAGASDVQGAELTSPASVGIPVTRVAPHLGRPLVDLDRKGTRARSATPFSMTAWSSTRHVVEAMRRCQARTGPSRTAGPVQGARCLDSPQSALEARPRLGSFAGSVNGACRRRSCSTSSATADGEALARIDVAWPRAPPRARVRRPEGAWAASLRARPAPPRGGRGARVGRAPRRPRRPSPVARHRSAARLTAALRRPAA